MTVYRLAAMAVAGVAWGFTSAGAEDAPKWGAHVDLEGKLGTERHLGEADLFLPLAQDDRNLLFANIRTRMDDNDSREGNFGLGVRHMLDSGWNLGGYGYFDRRRSELHNYFNQVTVGAEALSLDWDLRANVYAPIGRTTREVDSLNTAEISGASVIFRGGEERALGGFDAEIGWRAPLFDAEAGQQLRFYAGGYRFADDGVPTVAGPRGRAEMVFDEVPHLWEGSRLSLGAEWQHDEPRGSQGFLTARLRIPLQAEASPSRLTPLERRMADPIVRDVDIVAQAGAFGAAETATAGNGGALRVLNSTTTTGADLQTALNNAGTYSTVILSGTFNTDSTSVQLQIGQTVMGAGGVAVRSPSGRTASLNASTGATISAGMNNVTVPAVSMANNSTLTGMTIRSADTGGVIAIYGVQADGVSGATIANNSISVSDSTSNAIALRIINASTNITVTGNTIVATRTSGGGTAAGMQIIDNSTVTVADNSFAAYGGAGQYAVYRGGSTALAGSTGNTIVAGICQLVSTNNGPITFTDGSHCP